MRIELKESLADFKIEISLNPGVYRFRPLSGTGKSYLCHLVDTYDKLLGGGVLAVKPSTKHLYNLNNIPSNKRVIIFDRYDIYQRSCWELIDTLKDTHAILLDLKVVRDRPPFTMSYIDIIYTERGLIVSDGLHI